MVDMSLAAITAKMTVILETEKKKSSGVNLPLTSKNMEKFGSDFRYDSII